MVIDGTTGKRGLRPWVGANSCRRGAPGPGTCRVRRDETPALQRGLLDKNLLARRYLPQALVLEPIQGSLDLLGAVQPALDVLAR